MFQHTKHLTQSNKPNKKNRAKSGGRIEVITTPIIFLLDKITSKYYVLW